MRSPAILLMWCPVLFGCVQPSTSGTDAAEVEAVAQAFYEALDGDASVLQGMLTAEFQAVDAGRRMDRAEFEDFIAAAVVDGVNLEFDLSRFATRVAGDLAYTTFEAWNADRATTYFETLVLVRSATGWRVDRLHSTPMRPAEPVTDDESGDG